MTLLYRQILRKHARSLSPLPAPVAPRLAPLSPIRAVLLDVYGTMFASARGETGPGNGPGKEEAEACAAAMRAVGLVCSLSAEQCVAMLEQTVAAHHQRSRNSGVDFPEVDIAEVWAEVIEQLHRQGALGGRPEPSLDCRQLAVEYEARVNPVWPMPGLLASLAGLQRMGMVLGIISNSQFFTPELLPALLDCTASDAGFDPQLQYYSYRYHRAKPGLFLYERAKEDLAARGIDADKTVYVGNDMLKDVLPAKQTGFKAVLFAGDAGSLRLRENDPRIDGVSPDAILTELRQMPECFASNS